jgi:hypothetical protein
MKINHLLRDKRASSGKEVQVVKGPAYLKLTKGDLDKILTLRFSHGHLATLKSMRRATRDEFANSVLDGMASSISVLANPVAPWAIQMAKTRRRKTSTKSEAKLRHRIAAYGAAEIPHK